MSIQELQKQIQNAVFLTAQQKAALLTALPKLSDEQGGKLETFLTETPQKLGRLVVKQDGQRGALLSRFMEDLKAVEHRATHDVWKEAETLDKNKEDATLENLLKKL